MALPPALSSQRCSSNFRNAANPATESLFLKIAALLFSDTADLNDARVAGKSVWIGSGEGAPTGNLGTNIRGIYLREDAASLDTLLYLTVDGSTWTTIPGLPLTLADMSLASAGSVTISGAGKATFTGGANIVQGATNPDDLSDIAGIADGYAALMIAGTGVTNLVDSATLATPRNATIALAENDRVLFVRSGTVHYAIPLFVQAGVPTSAAGTGATGNTAETITDHPATACTGSAVADHGAITPAGSTDSGTVYDMQEFGPLAAPGVNYVAQYAGGAAIDDAVGPFVRFVPPRTVRVVLGVGGANPVVYTITGTDWSGTALVETITAAGAGTYEGARAFRTITRIQSDVNPVGTTDIRSGVGFGLGYGVTGIDGVGVDGVLEAPTSTHVATGTVVPATAPNAAHTYCVASRTTHTHALTGVTVTPPAHVITQPTTPILAHAGMGHTHTGPSHTHNS